MRYKIYFEIKYTIILTNDDFIHYVVIFMPHYSDIEKYILYSYHFYRFIEKKQALKIHLSRS